MEGAVKSTQEPVVAEIVAAPPFTDQLILSVVPFVTVANTRRTEPGSTLNPYGGCAIDIEIGGAEVVVVELAFEVFELLGASPATAKG